jgi:hypothetical protein
MVVTQSLVIDTGIAAARARLHRLVRGSRPAGGSRGGHEGVFTHRIRLGPFGDAPGVSELVTVRFVGPVRRGAVTTVWLRVQQAGPESGMFPVLDGDLTLTAESLEQARLTLNASYRPPHDGIGAGLDRAVMHHSASATIRALLHSIAAALDEPRLGPAQQAADIRDPHSARDRTPV